MSFPSIYIQNYAGTPVPVVDRKTGELVTIITRPQDFNMQPPLPSITVIPDNNPVGLTTDDPRFDIVLGGFFIENTGFLYKDPVIQIIDKDKERSNGEVEAVVREGRIVNVEIINTGTSFKRIPEITITDETGYGAVIFPVMNLIPKEGGDNPEFKSGEEGTPSGKPIEAIFCQSRDLKNLY